MDRLARVFLPVFAALTPASALALCGHSDGSNFCGPELIQQIYVARSGLVYVRPTTPLSPAPAGFTCTPVSGMYFALDPSSANFKQIYAALLTARLAGAPVTIVADPQQATCTISYITI